MVHEIDVSGNVPLYGQILCCYCGAASAQMNMNGYPNAADRLLVPQGPPTIPNCWDTIQANNSNDPVDVAQGWCTDPIGLRECLILLNPPPGGSWNVHMDANRGTVMFDIIFWMNRNNYPVAVLINRGGHWVVIVGYESDIEPVVNSTPVLNEITYHDPEPHNVGSVITKTGAQWYANEWNGDIQWQGTWFGNYVAVIEPPQKKGVVKIKMVERTGDKILNPEEALKHVYRWIDELRLAKKPQYHILANKNVTHYKPILVKEKIRPDLKEKVAPIYYYIVPFGFEQEKGPCGEPLTRLGIIINAYTGQFEEIGAFKKPVKYLPEKHAIMIAAKALALTDKQITEMVQKKAITTSIMFQPSEITHIRLYPFWKIAIKDKVLFIDQLGNLYNTIVPSRPGD